MWNNLYLAYAIFTSTNVWLILSAYLVIALKFMDVFYDIVRQFVRFSKLIWPALMVSIATLYYLCITADEECFEQDEHQQLVNLKWLF